MCVLLVLCVHRKITHFLCCPDYHPLREIEELDYIITLHEEAVYVLHKAWGISGGPLAKSE